MEKTLKAIMKSKPVSDPGYLFHTNLVYPDIEDNESNFITDYQANASSYNGYAILRRGNQVIDIDEDAYTVAWNYLKEMSGYVTDAHLDSWARLYYALSLSYNPLYNVDGSTLKEVTQRQRTDAYGAQSGSNTLGAISASDIHGAQSGSIVHGAQSETIGAHTDTQQQYSVSFDGATEKETGKTSNSIGAQSNSKATFTDQTSSTSYTDQHTEQARSDSHSEAAHSDTHTDAAYSETETRKGNIGVTMSQQLLNAEWEFRRRSFFEMIINQMLDEVGFYYNGGIGL